MKKNYLEFGTGGSTFMALLNSDCHIVSVESDIEWINFMRTYKIILNNENSRLEFLPIDIGKTKSFGRPLNDEKRENYPQYSKYVFQKNNSKEFDLIFVDGRFRVACVLQAILNCPKDIKILVTIYNVTVNTF